MPAGAFRPAGLAKSSRSCKPWRTMRLELHLPSSARIDPRSSSASGYVHLATCIARPGIPALFVFKHGHFAARHVGIMDVSSRRPWIESSLRRWIEQATT